jgi:NADH dehydrogenase [ubiquinone] 1 alpha subcomplex assembly factor 7
MSPAPADDSGAALLAVLREAIRRDGPMPVERFMRLCLADPVHGYWARPGTIGAAGDFVTAPEITQVFGELLGLWSAVVWQGMRQPSPLRLVELGPGRGTLMRDALRAAERVPGLLDALYVHLIETSEPLREMQRSLLTPPHVMSKTCLRHEGEGDRPAIEWHSSLHEVPDGPAIVIANEFLDALPIRQLVFGEDGWRERVVELDAEGGLRFAIGDKAAHARATPAAPPGAILELRAGEDEVLAGLGRRTGPCVALFIDYGPAELAYGDTLQAVRRHAYVDPFATPGAADLTAHVQFAAFADKARRAGLAADGPITQGEFLGALGIAERTARLMAANPERAGAIETATQRLVSPTGMGSLFKVLAVRSPHLPPPPPFG